MALGGDVIDGVDHEVRVWWQQLVRESGLIEERYSLDGRRGVDQSETLCQHIGLGLAHVSAHGLELSICIRHADQVKIHQREVTNPAAGERFR